MKKLATSITHMPKHSSGMTPVQFIRREISSHAARMAHSHSLGPVLGKLMRQRHRSHLHIWLERTRSEKVLSYINIPAEDITLVSVRKP